MSNQVHGAEAARDDRRERDGICDARILIADDDPLCRQLVESVLRRRNFANLEFAEGGVSALEQSRSFKPDLLLLDMQMPDMSGLDVCRRVRSDPDLADIPILVQTATFDRKKMGELFAGGASDFLSKPVNPSELIARVVVHLERWNSLRELRNYRERISRELEAARRMQFELLPSFASLSESAEKASMRIASYNRPSSELGGDLWGMLPIDEGAFGLFLADFTGHGVNAALNTFRLHALIHEYKNLHDAPAALLSVLNERLVRLLPPGQFATFLYVVVDHRRGELRFASAGAPPAILVQSQSGRPRFCEGTGLPLGIEPGAKYQTYKRKFPEGSLLLLFSDGLPEYPDSFGERIGDEGLLKVLNACHSGLAPNEVIDRLCAAAGITGQATLPDDTTVICIDRRIAAGCAQALPAAEAKAPGLRRSRRPFPRMDIKHGYRC
ncbi:fused response regulator/phosphatase [Bradyrhizobium sp. STM 3809]|uniref:PP2C family protein-serine/threonine phosphatase n=1 Tax=Bradyrhizobium sp. STM 3809 TaxID=551936 RepID=UPI000240824C|nr:fused response regulator/phosphatase [Bradyrhizobium sp. STM 3809]CCE03328.1 putative Response regulator, serine phosphatase [Bradyrhizobium sp. STM 3809]